MLPNGGISGHIILSKDAQSVYLRKYDDCSRNYKSLAHIHYVGTLLWLLTLFFIIPLIVDNKLRKNSQRVNCKDGSFHQEELS